MFGLSPFDWNGEKIFSSLVWFGIVWFGLVWFCFVLFGFVWFCLVLFCLVWFTVEKVLLVLVKVLLFYQGLLLCSWDCIVGLYSGTM